MAGQDLERGYWLGLTWNTASYYTRMRRPVALVRALARVILLHDNGEVCQVCGRSYVLWASPDYLYGQVIGSSSGLYCPRCFERKAKTAGYDLIWCPRLFQDRRREKFSPPEDDEQADAT